MSLVNKKRQSSSDTDSKKANKRKTGEVQLISVKTFATPEYELEPLGPPNIDPSPPKNQAELQPPSRSGSFGAYFDEKRKSDDDKRRSSGEEQLLGPIPENKPVAAEPALVRKSSWSFKRGKKTKM